MSSKSATTRGAPASSTASSSGIPDQSFSFSNEEEQQNNYYRFTSDHTMNDASLLSFAAEAGSDLAAIAKNDFFAANIQTASKLPGKIYENMDFGKPQSSQSSNNYHPPDGYHQNRPFSNYSSTAFVGEETMITMEPRTIEEMMADRQTTAITEQEENDGKQQLR